MSDKFVTDERLKELGVRELSPWIEITHEFGDEEENEEEERVLVEWNGSKYYLDECVRNENIEPFHGSAHLTNSSGYILALSNCLLSARVGLVY